MAGKKNEKLGFTTSQLFNFTRDSYLERTSRPVYAILFLLPFIIFYEIGTILINTDLLNRSQVRVVAFVWLQDLLVYLGTGHKVAWIAPPLVVVVILLGFQIASRKPWWFCVGDYTPMVLECILLAVPLIILSLFFNSPAVRDAGWIVPTDLLPEPGAVVRTMDGGHSSLYACGLPHSPEDLAWRTVSFEPASAAGGRMLPLVQSVGGPAVRSLMADIVTGVGAGIYEELVFRLILICALMVLFQDVIGIDHKNAVILSVLISAALFSAHHHHITFIAGQLGRGAPFSLAEFVFRTAAGIYFAGLFAIRGFGITAGTHAFYDIIATVINAFFFTQN
jgi:hypothetical protein